jgi:hypothetical protein
VQFPARDGLPKVAEMWGTRCKIRISDNGWKMTEQIMVTVGQEMDSDKGFFPRDCIMSSLGVFPGGQ